MPATHIRVITVYREPHFHWGPINGGKYMDLEKPQLISVFFSRLCLIQKKRVLISFQWLAVIQNICEKRVTLCKSILLSVALSVPLLLFTFSHSCFYLLKISSSCALYTLVILNSHENYFSLFNTKTCSLIIWLVWLPLQLHSRQIFN